MLRLFQRQGAGRPLRVRWALEEAGAAYDYVVMTREEGHAQEHATRHPLGRVPVLETEDGLLFESAALCLHVADLHPDAGLIPATGSAERGQVYQWSFFAMTELEPAVTRAYVAHRDGDADAMAKTRERLARAALVVATALDGRSYVVGGVLESARRFDLFPDSPELRAYLERLDARPAKQRAYAE